MRSLLALAVGLAALSTAHRADACIRAGETNKLLGWSADGAYSLAALVDAKGVYDHAEILPTTYSGSVYVIMPVEEHGFVLTKVKVGACAAFGDDGAGVIERGKGTLTEQSLLTLAAVKAMKFGRLEVEAKAPTPTAAFTGKKRFDVHDLELTVNDTKTTIAVPVWCVGSCLADENWTKWTAKVAAVHTLASGRVLYEMSLANVCNGGTLLRLVAPTPPAIKVPKKRCTGSGD